MPDAPGRDGLLVRTPRIGYREAWDAQLAVAAARRAGETPDVVWLLEHDPVYTYGRHGTRGDLHIDDDALAASGATCVRTDRGGQMTWHGPGQTTGYAIVDLRPGRAVRRFVEALITAMRDAAQAAGVRGAEPDMDRMGLYVAGRKLGSVGIRVTGGVTLHGLALNRDPSLRWYLPMTACGAPDVRATTIAAEGGDPSRDDVERVLAASLAASLDLRLRPADGLPVAPADPGARTVASGG